MVMFKKYGGFTIVELLIVIVVLAILAAISIIAYNGIQGRAYDSAVKSDLNNFGKAVQAYREDTGTLPGVDSSGNKSIGNILTSLTSNQSLISMRFSKGSYGNLTSATRTSLLLHDGPANQITYICLSVMSKSGTPMYWSTEKGWFEVAKSGSPSDGYNFVNNCGHTGSTTQTYGSFSLDSYS